MKQTNNLLHSLQEQEGFSIALQVGRGIINYINYCNKILNPTTITERKARTDEREL